MIIPLPESDLTKLLDEYEAIQKNIKDDLYRIVWYMRGGVSYSEIMYEIDIGDKEILNKIIKSNWEQTNKSGLPLV